MLIPRPLSLQDKPVSQPLILKPASPALSPPPSASLLFSSSCKPCKHKQGSACLASFLHLASLCSSPPRQASPAIQPISQSCQPCYPKPCLTSLAGALGLAGLLFLPGCRHGWLWLPGFSFALWLLSGGKFPPGPPLKKKIFCSESLVGLSFSCTAKPAMFLLQYTSVP